MTLKPHRCVPLCLFSTSQTGDEEILSVNCKSAMAPGSSSSLVRHRKIRDVDTELTVHVVSRRRLNPARTSEDCTANRTSSFRCERDSGFSPCV